MYVCLQINGTLNVDVVDVHSVVHYNRLLQHTSTTVTITSTHITRLHLLPITAICHRSHSHTVTSCILWQQWQKWLMSTLPVQGTGPVVDHRKFTVLLVSVSWTPRPASTRDNGGGWKCLESWNKDWSIASTGRVVTRIIWFVGIIRLCQTRKPA